MLFYNMQKLDQGKQVALLLFFSPFVCVRFLFSRNNIKVQFGFLYLCGIFGTDVLTESHFHENAMHFDFFVNRMLTDDDDDLKHKYH